VRLISSWQILKPIVVGTAAVCDFARDKEEMQYLFQHVHFANHASEPDQYSPHVIGRAGNEVWSNGKWNATLQSHGLGTVKQEGYWSEIYVRLEGSGTSPIAGT
jgi:hypothetical protein